MVMTRPDSVSYHQEFGVGENSHVQPTPCSNGFFNSQMHSAHLVRPFLATMHFFIRLFPFFPYSEADIAPDKDPRALAMKPADKFMRWLTAILHFYKTQCGFRYVVTFRLHISANDKLCPMTRKRDRDATANAR